MLQHYRFHQNGKLFCLGTSPCVNESIECLNLKGLRNCYIIHKMMLIKIALLQHNDGMTFTEKEISPLSTLPLAVSI